MYISGEEDSCPGRNSWVLKFGNVAMKNSPIFLATCFSASAGFAVSVFIPPPSLFFVLFCYLAILQLCLLLMKAIKLHSRK